MNIIEKYNKSLQDIYDHVGFKEDWVVCPLSDDTEYYWKYKDGESHVRYAKTIEDLNTSWEVEDGIVIGEYYEDEIYKQRFYKKWVYEGNDYTMIFCDPHVDGMKYFRLFDNKKLIK